MLTYPLKIDSRIAQAVAIVTFMVNYTILLRPELNWLIYVLTADFILRYIHPRLSPIAQFFVKVSALLNLEKKFYFAPPKRFAALIGVIFTLTISIATFFSIIALQYIFIYLILFASFLQGFLDYCVGCELYDVLIRVGIINDYHTYTLN